MWVHAKVKTALSDLFYLLWYKLRLLISHIYEKIFLLFRATVCHFGEWHKTDGALKKKNGKIWHGDRIWDERYGQKTTFFRVMYFLIDPMSEVKYQMKLLICHFFLWNHSYLYKHAFCFEIGFVFSYVRLKQILEECF